MKSRFAWLVALAPLASAAEPTIRYENCGELARPSPSVEIVGTQLRSFLPKGTRCPIGVACLGERVRPLASAKALALRAQLQGLTQEWVAQASDYRKANRVVNDAGCSQLTIGARVLRWETVWEPWDADSRRLYGIQRTFDELIVAD